MTTVQRIRVWLRRAPLGERIGVAVVIAVALCLLGLAVVPEGGAAGPGGGAGVVAAGRGSGGSGTAPSGSGGGGALSAPAGAAGTSGAPGGSTAPLGASASSGSGPGAQSSGGPASSAGPGPAGAGGAAGHGCASPPGSDQGITTTQIKVAVTLINIVGPAGNATFGVPPPAEQQADYQEVIDAVNAGGGVVCRKLVPLFYPVNNADSSDQQQKCLDIVQAGVFAVLDAGGYFESSAMNCFPQNHIPFVAAGFITADQRDQFYPYLFGRGLFDTLYKNTAFGLKERGFYSPAGGFRKLGLVYRSCFPELISQYFTWLHQIGLSGSQIVGYDLGCPSAFATPSDLEQAILKFQQAGVTSVTGVGSYADFANFTDIAQQQGFHPRYGMPDDGVFGVSYGSQHPDYSNIANALLITADRLGEERTPGMSPTPATARCDAIYRAANRPPTWQQYISGGQACNNVWMLDAALQHAASLQRADLVAGLQATGSVDFSYPYGPNNFGGARVTFGDEFWRPLQFFASCNCWRVVDPTFHPSF